MTGLSPSQARELTVAEVAAYRELIEQENAVRRHAYRRR
jgi:membrane glycosyltransferase